VVSTGIVYGVGFGQLIACAVHPPESARAVLVLPFRNTTGMSIHQISFRAAPEVMFSFSMAGVARRHGQTSPIGRQVSNFLYGDGGLA